MARLWRMRCAAPHGTHARVLFTYWTSPRILCVVHTISTTGTFCSAKSLHLTPLRLQVHGVHRRGDLQPETVMARCCT